MMWQKEPGDRSQGDLGSDHRGGCDLGQVT